MISMLQCIGNNVMACMRCLPAREGSVAVISRLKAPLSWLCPANFCVVSMTCTQELAQSAPILQSRLGAMVFGSKPLASWQDILLCTQELAQLAPVLQSCLEAMVFWQPLASWQNTLLCTLNLLQKKSHACSNFQTGLQHILQKVSTTEAGRTGV